MTLDATFRALAAKLTGQYGKSITLREFSSTFDPGTGDNVETPIDHEVKVSPPAPYERDYIDGSQVQAGDMRLIVAAVDAEPKLDWRVVMDGDEWQIITIRPMWSGEQVAAYEIQARR